MNIRQFHKILIFATLLLFVNSSFAQYNTGEAYLESEIKERPFNKGQWETIIQELEYTKDAVKKDSEQKKEDDLVVDVDEEVAHDIDELNRNSGENENAGFWASFFKLLIIAGAIIIVALIMANLMRSGEITKKRSIKNRVKTVSKINIKNIEENIHETDLDRLIKQALTDKSYALVIRLYYLAAIKELSLNKIIRWKKDKTNRDYLREMSENQIVKPFREATNIFERVWYGDSELNESDFEQLKPKFQQLVAAAKRQSGKMINTDI